MRELLILLTGLVLSGLISSLSFPLYFLYIPIPGIIFGSVIMLWLQRSQKLEISKRLIWMIGCILAWEAAYAWAMFKFKFGGIEAEYFLEFGTAIFASVLGSFLLSATMTFINKNIKVSQIIAINILGVVAGLLISLINTSEIPGPPFLLEFITWQLLIGVASAYLIRKNLREVSIAQGSA